MPPSYPIPAVRRAAKRSSDTERTAHPFDFLPTGPTVWEAIGDLPDLDEFEVLWTSDEVKLTGDVMSWISREASPYARMLRGEVEDIDDSRTLVKWDSSLLTSSMRTAHTAVSIRRFMKTKQGQTESISRFYRLDRNGLCNTLRAGTGSERGAFTSPRPLHPTLPRVISVREAARLHSFPDWFRFHRTKWHGFRSVGNAVPPLFGRAVARSVIKALGLGPGKPLYKRSVLGNTVLLSFDRLSATKYFGADQTHIPKTRLRITRT